MGYRIGVKCSIGVGPDAGGRERNEDNYLVCHEGLIQYLEDDQPQALAATGDGAFVAVCDGMGGHDDGHVASLTAAKAMSRLYRPGVPSNPERALLKYIRESHDALYWRAAEQGPVTMGTTLCAAWLLHGTVSWTNVGDSRMYRIREGRLDLLTLDHTRNEFARRDSRPLDEENGDHLAQNFIYGSRGLGDNSTLRLEPGVDTGTLPLEPGDRLLLCSDGLWAFTDSSDLTAVLAQHPDPQLAAEALVQLAEERNAIDNITAIVVCVDEQAPPSVQWTDDFDALSTQEMG